MLLTPPVDQNLGSGFGSDRLGVFQRLPRELGERFPEHHRPTLLLTEAVLLAIRRIPDPIHKQVRHI